MTLNVRYRGTELNINEELIRLNYADRAEESYSSVVCMLFLVLFFFDFFVGFGLLIVFVLCHGTSVCILAV